jgi:hypothetical protein
LANTDNVHFLWTEYRLKFQYLTSNLDRDSRDCFGWLRA